MATLVQEARIAEETAAKARTAAVQELIESAEVHHRETESKSGKMIFTDITIGLVTLAGIRSGISSKTGKVYTFVPSYTSTKINPNTQKPYENPYFRIPREMMDIVRTKVEKLLLPEIKG